jgi:hypothetical protein
MWLLIGNYHMTLQTNHIYTKIKIHTKVRIISFAYFIIMTNYIICFVISNGIESKIDTMLYKFLI